MLRLPLVLQTQAVAAAAVAEYTASLLVSAGQADPAS
jgi:hypothetical protein